MHEGKVQWHNKRRQESKAKPSLVGNKIVLLPAPCEIIYSSTYGILVEEF